MGFLSKIWKGVKKITKKIFKPIKKIFKSVGKFMNKIGIVGQIAMSFLLPGIGTALSGMFSGMVSSLAGGALGTIGKAAGWVLGKAGQFAKTISTGFKTVTSAVTDFIGAAGKYVGGKLGGMGIGTMKEITLKQAFGAEGWAGKLVNNFSKFGDAAKGLFTDGVSDFASRGIMTPAEAAAKQAAIPVEDLSIDTADIGDPSLDPLDPNSKFQKDFQRQFEINPEIEGKSLLGPQQQLPLEVVPAAFESGYQVDPTTGQRVPGSTRYAVDAPPSAASASPAITPDAASSADIGFFEKITGKKDISTLVKDAPGDLFDYGVDTVKGIPGQMVQGQLMSLIQGSPEAYEEGRLWGGNTYAYQSQDYSRITGGATSGDYFGSFINFNDSNGMYNNLPQGQYGGIDAFNTFYQRGTA